MPPPPSPTTRVTTGIMDAKIPATTELSERCRGGRRVCAPMPTASPSPSTRSAAAPPLKLPCPATATVRRLGEQLRPLVLPGYPSIHCHRLCQPRVVEQTIGAGSDHLRCEEGGGKLPRPPQPPPPVSTTHARNHHHRIHLDLNS
jgi:hypothetical protein